MYLVWATVYNKLQKSQYEEDFMDIITMRLHLDYSYDIEKKLQNCINFHYVAILALPKGLNPDTGVMNFYNFVEGIMNINCALKFFQNVWE